MKKILMLTCLLMLSATAQAKKISCDIEVLAASESGLMRKENFKMTADSKAEVPCEAINTLGYKLRLCVDETELIGGYLASVSVDLLSEPKPKWHGEEAHSIVSLGTLKQTGEVTAIKGTRSAHYNQSMLIKLDKANLDYDYEGELVSDLMDTSVSKAVKMGILNEGDILLFRILDCQD